MRRSTAAAVGTLTGAALIIGVRLSVAVPGAPVAAPPAVDLGDTNDLPPSSSPPKSGSDSGSGGDADSGSAGTAGGSGLKNGVHQGAAVKNPYGSIQVSIKVEGGKITAADATYPTANNSAEINPPAIATLNEEAVQAQSAEVDAVSGATFTSASYTESLQAAIDKAS
jgi:uncharacterized protein with FMN-binding domain